MKGDFSRNIFDPLKHFSRVLMQQGRVQLDADWNEQVSILLHYLQTLAKDLIGPYGGPSDDFRIGVDAVTLGLNDGEWKTLNEKLKLRAGDFVIRKGHYYVDGILCKNDDYRLYSDQPDLHKASPLKKDALATYLVYLDVWERHITYLEDEDGNNPSIREVALGGPDTATRAKVIWQVKVTDKDHTGTKTLDASELANITKWQDWLAETSANERLSRWEAWRNQWQAVNRGQLKAKGKEDREKDINPCITSPESRYRGTENQLYRVEIHTGGTDGTDGTATFKWSRENGSVVFPIREPLQGNIVKLEHLGRDSRFGLKVDDWVEITDDDYVLQGRAEPLLQVEKIDPINMEVTLKKAPAYKVGPEATKHPLLRRWDHKKGDPARGGLDVDDNLGAAKIVESTETWLTLEDGVQIQFVQAGKNENAHYYRTGDYWLIPARTATGDVEWPQDGKGAIAQPPRGVEHYYAPLAIIAVGTNGDIERKADLRCTIEPLGKPVP